MWELSPLPHFDLHQVKYLSNPRMHKGHPKVAFVWVKRQLSARLT